jgi:hypothetical protein
MENHNLDLHVQMFSYRDCQMLMGFTVCIWAGIAKENCIQGSPFAYRSYAHMVINIYTTSVNKAFLP